MNVSKGPVQKVKIEYQNIKKYEFMIVIFES